MVTVTGLFVGSRVEYCTGRSTGGVLSILFTVIFETVEFQALSLKVTLSDVLMLYVLMKSKFCQFLILDHQAGASRSSGEDMVTVTSWFVGSWDEYEGADIEGGTLSIFAITMLAVTMFQAVSEKSTVSVVLTEYIFLKTYLPQL